MHRISAIDIAMKVCIWQIFARHFFRSKAGKVGPWLILDTNQEKDERKLEVLHLTNQGLMLDFNLSYLIHCLNFSWSERVSGLPDLLEAMLRKCGCGWWRFADVGEDQVNIIIQYNESPVDWLMWNERFSGPIRNLDDAIRGNPDRAWIRVEFGSDFTFLKCSTVGTVQTSTKVRNFKQNA